MCPPTHTGCSCFFDVSKPLARQAPSPDPRSFRHAETVTCTIEIQLLQFGVWSASAREPTQNRHHTLPSGSMLAIALATCVAQPVTVPRSTAMIVVSRSANRAGRAPRVSDVEVTTKAHKRGPSALVAAKLDRVVEPDQAKTNMARRFCRSKRVTTVTSHHHGRKKTS